MTTSADYRNFIRNGQRIPGTAVRWTDIFDRVPLPPTWDYIYAMERPQVINWNMPVVLFNGTVNGTSQRKCDYCGNVGFECDCYGYLV